jgi:hypothetical protein
MAEQHKEKVLEKHEEKKEVTSADVLKKIQDVLKEFNGMESNIPMNHEYWSLKATLQGMQAAERDKPVVKKEEKEKK